MFISAELARRLEIAEALDGVDCGEACAHMDPEEAASVRAIAGGFCIYCGETSPLTHALGIGLHGPVLPEDLAEVEEFFRSRGAPVAIDVTPYSDPSLREVLCRRKYQITEMNTVLVRSIHPGEAFPDCAPGVTVRSALSEEIDLYSRTLMCGFFSREESTEEELRLGRILFRMPAATPLLAMVGDQPAGGCGMSARNGVGSFFGDATLPQFRGRGVHTSMIAERLRRAQSAGCDLATAGTQPGSISQRNYQKLGFEVAYSKITFVLE